MAEQNPNARPDEQTPEQDALEKSLEELSLDELLASVKDDLARVDAMMDGPGDAAQPEQPRLSWSERRSRRSSLPICPRCLN